ncbi:MAG: MipA/OmpV family protein [Sphingobium sp.]|nr:MipA/OmpV family protein [Sphingobium sp.]
MRLILEYGFPTRGRSQTARSFRLRVAPFAPLALLLIASPVYAQDAPPADPLSQSPDAPAVPTVFDGDYLTVGAGAAYGPGYEGSDSYVLFPVIGLQGSLGGLTISPRPAGLALDVVRDLPDSKVSFAFGPVARARFDRNRQVRDPVVFALGRRGIAVEVGANAGVNISKLTNPYDSLSIGVDVRWDVANVHKGTVIQPTVSYLTPLSKAFAAVLSLTAEHVDGNYARYYFDVTPSGSAATGLPVYTAHNGWKSAGLSLLTFYDLDHNLANGGFAVVGGVSYSRMLGNIARSPIISVRGAKAQWLMGAGVAYTF